MNRLLIAILAVVFAGSIAFGTDWNTVKYKGHDSPGQERSTSLVIGVTDAMVVNVNTGTQTTSNNANLDLFQDCRAISCDSTGIIKIDVRSIDGTPKTVVMTINAGVMYPIRNVIAVYQYYVGTTACTAKIFHENGQSYAGIRLWR